jgi:hypothetical protein
MAVPEERICGDCAKPYLARNGMTIFCVACRVSDRAKYRRYALKIKERVYTVYGNCCKHCGFSDRRALQLDHVLGGGTKERKEKRWSSSSVYADALKNPEKYQLLCANCNAIKRYENQEIPVNVHYKCFV